MRYNNLTIEAYSTGTTLIVDPAGDLPWATGLSFATQYPGGLYAEASFQVERKITDWWELQGATRIVIRNELRQVYEGYITNIQHTIEDFGQTSTVRCIGAWGKILMNWPICKRWVDDRITDNVWVQQTIAGTTVIETENWTVERQDRIHITANPGGYSSGEYTALRYTMPTGETIKRITYDYNMAESAGESWEMSLHRSVDGTTFVSMGTAETYTLGSTTVHTTTGVGTVDVALATASQYVDLRFYARATNNVTNSDHDHGLWQNLKVYSELGNINMSEIATDVVGYVTDLNTDTRLITSPTTQLSLVPFIADNFPSAAEIVNQAASQGDGEYNRWAAYIVGSERAFIPNGKPLLVLNQYPATTDYEYAIRLDDDNLVTPFTISQDFDIIANWIIVQYTDKLGVVRYRSPNDNAALKDQTSIDKYGTCSPSSLMPIVIPGISTQDIADAIGRRYLATSKDPQYRLMTPIIVREYIRGKVGHIYPASEIRSRDRIRIEDFLQDVSSSMTGLTFVITGTAYDDETEICGITTGVPLSPLMLRYTPELVSSIATTTSAPGTPSATGGGVERTITGNMLRKMGTNRGKWGKMTPAQRRAAKRKAGL